MFRLLCVALVLICITGAAVKSQPTIGDTDIVCSDDEFSEIGQQHNQHIGQALETERRLVQELRKRVATLEKQVSATANLCFLTTLNSASWVNGVTYSENKIYTLLEAPKSVRVYEDREPFALQKIINIDEVQNPEDLAYSKNANCLYITDKDETCIWKIDLRTDRVTKWLLQISEPFTLSMSTEGHVVILKKSYLIWHLEIYGLDAVLLRRIQLANEIQLPQHAIQTPTGDFIITHCMIFSSSVIWVISKVSSDGQVVNRYDIIPLNVSKECRAPCHLAYDSVNNRMFVLDVWAHEVTLLDADFRWRQILLSMDTHGIYLPTRVSYSPQKSQLIVGLWGNGTKVFQISQGIN